MPIEFSEVFLYYGPFVIVYYFILFNLQTTSSIFLQLKRRSFSILSVAIVTSILSWIIVVVLIGLNLSLLHVISGVSIAVLAGIVFSFILDQPRSFVSIGSPVLISIAASGFLSVLNLFLGHRDGFPLMIVLSLSIISPFGLYVLEYMRQSPRKELA